MFRLKSFLKSIPSPKIISGLCYIPLLIVLFVPTTSFLPSLLPVDVWYKASLLGAIVLAIISGRLFRRDVRTELLDKEWLLWLLAFIGWVGLVWICQPDNISEHWDIKYWLLPAGLALFLWVASPQSWKAIGVCFLIVGLINSLAGFGIWVAHHFNPAYQTSISSDPNVVATGQGWYYLIGGGIPPVAGLRGGVAINGMADLLFWPFMILVGYVAIGKRRWLFILGILIISLGIFTTYSRSTAIVMVLGIAFFIFLRRKGGMVISRRLFVAILALVTLVPALLLLFLPRSLVGTVFFRFEMWQKMFAFLTDFPNTYLSGGGFPRILDYPYGVWDTHSIYFYLLIAFGIPGLLLFLIPFGYILREGWNNFSKGIQSPMDTHTAAALSALVCFLVRGLVESQVNEMDWRMAFVLFFVYAAATIRGEFSKTAPLPETASSLP